MKVVRTFHPVGQGAFCSERFFTYGAAQQIEMHYMVYDCGVCFGNERKVNHVVNQAFTCNDEIDYLFISHLDYDHVSLVKTLMNRVKSVKNIVLPLVSEEYLVIAMVYYQILGYGETVEFFREILERLGKIKDDNSIIFIGGDEENNNRNENVITSSMEISIPWEPDWVFIPHNVKYRSRRQELITELGSVLDEQSFTDAIKQIETESFENAETLIKKLKESEFVKKVLVIPALRRAVKSAYASIEGGTNENSLLLYSGPKSGNWRYEIECTEPVRTWYHCDRHRVGCLYTGDSTCDLKGWENAKYSGVWDLIGTIQLPHHGSVESFDVATNPIDRSYVFPVSFGTYNTYGHPSGKVLAYLLVCNCCIQIVTEMMNTAYMQEIVRW